ncbi:MAG: glycerate kinase type-2 family protein [Thermomicrobiales bacterium]
MSASPAEETILDLYHAALAAVEPAAAVRSHFCREGRELVLDDRRIPVHGRLLMVGAGKAAVRMARGVEAICGELIDGGLVITKDGCATGELPSRVAVREASHPIPDQRGVAATRELLELVSEAGPDDVVLAIISGGGSALLEAPRPPVTLEEMARVTDLLLRAGAPIEDLNAVRIPLSVIKGGGLRRAAGEANVVTLILSDVLGNDPRIIASGPTVPGAATGERALDVLSRYGVLEQTPESVRVVLSEAMQSDPIGTSQDALVIVGGNEAAIVAAERRARARGFAPMVAWRAKTGEASMLGRDWVDLLPRVPEDVDVVLGGGEATVTVRGDGVGGRNTEFALAAAIALHEAKMTDWTVASLATDGDDGLAGAAGAIASEDTAERARSLGVDLGKALHDNDSGRFFAAVGGLVRPGPTGTNVNDLYFAVRRR